MAFCECGRRCGPRIPARLVRWAWVGKRGDGQRRSVLPEVCKKSLQAMASDMQGAIKPEFWSTYSIEELRNFSPRELESCGRLVQPLLYRYGQKYYRPIEWPQALERVVAKLKSLPARQTFWYCSGRSSNEAGFLQQLFARMYGTNNVTNCSYYCHQASGVGLTSSLGSGTATILLEGPGMRRSGFCDRRQSVQQPSADDDDLDACATARRRGDRGQPRAGSRAGGVSGTQQPAQHVVWDQDRHPLYSTPCRGDLALLTGIAKRIDEMEAQTNRFSAPIVKTMTSGLGTCGRSPGAQSARSRV